MIYICTVIIAIGLTLSIERYIGKQFLAIGFDSVKLSPSKQVKVVRTKQIIIMVLVRVRIP